MTLPEVEEFYEVDLDPDKKSELEKMEKD